jgi:adenosylcobinamide-GDP ribazoletransferase
MKTAAGLVQELRLGFVALQFLTRVPAPRWVGFEPGWLNESARHFPLVGALVGTAGAAVLLAASALWPPAVAALLALAATLVLTGAFHEDGLADTLDALGGAVPRERALLIMKDSRIGSYGAAAMVLSLGARAALMAALCTRPWAAAAAAMVLSHGLGRAAAVALMALLPYAGDADHAKAKPLATAIGWAQWTVALGWAAVLVSGAVACEAIEPSRAAVVLFAVAAVVLAMRRWLRRRLGGYTGDTLGACEQLSELAVLLALTAV